MAFVKKTWKDRIVQYANRRLLTKSGGEVEQVTVTRDEGTISEAGDQFNASNMNDLEQRVDDGFDDLNAADLPITSGSATNTKDYIDGAISELESYSLTDYSTNIASNWNNITSSGCYAMQIGKVGIITVRIKTSSMISSGSLTLTSLPFASPREIWGALSSLDNKGGFIQLNGKELLIRCSASPDNFLAGQVVVPISS